MSWIVVRNWEKFQHYKDRRPVWIKTYTEITSLDEYRDLSLAARGVLHGLWVEYSNGRGVIKQGASLSQRLGKHVSKHHLEALVQAGFIELSDSKPGELSAIPEKEKRREETPLPPSGKKSENNNHPEEPSPYAAHGNAPRLKAAEAWAKNGLLAEVPPENRERVLMDEFNISYKEAKRLVKAA